MCYAEKRTICQISCSGEAYKRIGAVLRGINGTAEQICYQANVECVLTVPTSNLPELVNTLNALRADYTIKGESFVAV